MENDLLLKHFLKYDNKVNKIEMRMSLDYLKCKLDNCYSKPKYTHEEYEECKSQCMKDMNKFKLLKDFLYKDFTEFYYQKFLDCSKIQDESKYLSCKAEAKDQMSQNINEIKQIIYNYKLG